VNGSPVQYCGKDNLRQQSAMWQAMLISAGLTPTHTIVIDGFCDWCRWSKNEQEYGKMRLIHTILWPNTARMLLRYFVLRELQPFEDSPFTIEQFKQSYNANLANGLGNLASRVLKMAVSYEVSFDALPAVSQSLSVVIAKHVENFELNKAMDEIWKTIATLDLFVQQKRAVQKVKVDREGAHADIRFLLSSLADIADVLNHLCLLPLTQ